MPKFFKMILNFLYSFVCWYVTIPLFVGGVVVAGVVVMSILGWLAGQNGLLEIVQGLKWEWAGWDWPVIIVYSLMPFFAACRHPVEYFNTGKLADEHTDMFILFKDDCTFKDGWLSKEEEEDD